MNLTSDNVPDTNQSVNFDISTASDIYYGIATQSDSYNFNITTTNCGMTTPSNFGIVPSESDISFNCDISTPNCYINNPPNHNNSISNNCIADCGNSSTISGSSTTNSGTNSTREIINCNIAEFVMLEALNSPLPRNLPMIFIKNVLNILK